MTESIQQIIVVFAVVAAAAYVLVHFLRRRKFKAGCRSCPAMRDFAEKTSPRD